MGLSPLGPLPEGGEVSTPATNSAPEWLRSKGKGHLTRIHDILTNLMEAGHRAGSGR